MNKIAIRKAGKPESFHTPLPVTQRHCRLPGGNTAERLQEQSVWQRGPQDPRTTPRSDGLFHGCRSRRRRRRLPVRCAGQRPGWGSWRLRRGGQQIVAPRAGDCAGRAPQEGAQILSVVSLFGMTSAGLLRVKIDEQPEGPPCDYGRGHPEFPCEAPVLQRISQ